MASNDVLEDVDIVNVRFKPTRFRPGYSQDEVDDYLDEVISILRGGDLAGHRKLLKTPEFTVVKFVEGYEMEDVDAFIPRVISTLRTHVETLPAQDVAEEVEDTTDEDEDVLLIHRPELVGTDTAERKTEEIISLLVAPGLEVSDEVRSKITRIIEE